MDKIVIRKEDCKFVKNMDKRKTVCILEVEGNIISRFLYKYNDTISLYPTLQMPEKFVGIATCSPNDEWDDNIGETVAFFKAKQKFYNKFFKLANSYINDLDVFINELIDKCNLLGDRWHKDLENLDKRIEGFYKKEKGEES